MDKMEIEKIAVVGLDGLSWDFLQVLINHGIFTKIKNILAKSFKSTLYAYPPTSFPSWSSILTGVNPGKHGIFSFDYLDRETLTQRLYTALDLEHPRIHEMLAMNNIPSIMFNPIPDYPLIPMRNIRVVSHMFFTPKTTYYPESMKKYASILSEPPKIIVRSKTDLLNSLYHAVNSYLSIIEELINEDWRVFWINLNIPDPIHHKLPETILKGEISTKVAKIFTITDKIVGKLNEVADILIILSDHGFNIYQTLISVNDFLAKKGYIKLTMETRHALKEHKEIFLEEIGVGKGNVRYVKISPTLRSILKPFKPIIKRAYKLITGSEIRSVRLLVDPKGSAAFLQSRSSFGVYIREKALKSKIKEELSLLPGIKWVKSREEVFHGPYVMRAPDLMLHPDFERGFTIAGNKVHGQIFLKTKSASHSPFGVFILHDNSNVLNLDARAKISIMMNYHVAPIIMYMVKAPLSHLINDVSVLKKLLDTGRLKYRNYVSLWKIVKRVSRIKRLYVAI